MLPPGHIAAGFLTAKVLLHFTHPQLTHAEQTNLLWWGMFFSFAPDLDNFVAFAKVKGWWYKPGTDNSIHRKFYSHIPILWLTAGLLIYFFASNVFVKEIGLLVWLGSWSHFILDSIDYGVMWLWPLNNEVWAIRNRGVKIQVPGNGFFQYWRNMVMLYTRSWTFYTELAILIVTIFIIK